MNLATYSFSLDVHKRGSQLMLEAKKNDTGRKLLVTLMENGKPYNITSDCYAVFRARKIDGTVLYNDCSIEDNEISYTITQQTLAVPGMLDCEITLYGSDGKQITSPSFGIIVDETVQTDNEIESTNEFTALTKAMSDYADAKENLGTGGGGSTGGGGGINGKDGKSAYEIALEHGFKGTESEWLESLEGEDGVSATHFWNGTVLTVSSASGTSSADLKGDKGDKGDTGATGETGEDGFSPTVSVSKVGKVTTIAITDKNGTKTATINDGKDGTSGSGEGGGGTGADGEDGIGIASIVQTTKSTEDDGINIMTITLTDGSTHTFEVQNGSKGSQGDKGDKGDKGDTGATGSNGTSATHSWNGTTLTITSASGTSSANLKGEKGDKGDKGDTGTNATTTAVATTSANGLMSSSDKTKLNGIAEGANNYSHPTYTAKSTQSVYKIKVDSTGHVSAATAATTETWTFTLASGSTVTKKVVLG